MAHLPIKPLTTGQRIMGGITIFKPHDSDRYIKFGPVDSVTWTPTLTEIDSRSDETGTSQLIGKWPVQQDGKIEITGIQMWSDLLYDSLFLATREFITQAAVTSASLTLLNIAIGDVIRIPGYNPTIISVTDTTSVSPVDYTEDEDATGDGEYIFHQNSGLLEVTGKPSGANSTLVITYSLPLITSADKLPKREIMKTGGTRGELRVIGTTDGGLPGDPVTYVFRDVKFMPNGAVNLKNAKELNTGSLTGDLFNASGQGYGYIIPAA